jgi:hypothetical protein
MASVMTKDGQIHRVEQEFIDQCMPIKMVTTMLDCSDDEASYIMPLPFDSEVLILIQNMLKRKQDCLDAMKYLCIK